MMHRKAPSITCHMPHCKRWSQPRPWLRRSLAFSRMNRCPTPALWSVTKQRAPVPPPPRGQVRRLQAVSRPRSSLRESEEALSLSRTSPRAASKVGTEARLGATSRPWRPAPKPTEGFCPRPLSPSVEGSTGASPSFPAARRVPASPPPPPAQQSDTVHAGLVLAPAHSPLSSVYVPHEGVASATTE